MPPLPPRIAARPRDGLPDTSSSPSHDRDPRSPLSRGQDCRPGGHSEGPNTRSHPELGRENPQRRWYCTSRCGRVGRRQARNPYSLFPILKADDPSELPISRVCTLHRFARLPLRVKSPSVNFVWLKPARRALHCGGTKVHPVKGGVGVNQDIVGGSL